MDSPHQALLAPRQQAVFSHRDIRTALYRPFTKMQVYFNRMFQEDLYRFPRSSRMQNPKRRIAS